MIRLILLLLFVSLVLAIKFLPVPWYVWVIAAAVLIASLKFLGGKMLQWLFFLPFKAKSRVLRDAEAQVHTLRPAEAPPHEPEQNEEWEDDEEPDEEMSEAAVPKVRERLDHYELEVTITPKPPSGKFTHWEPGEVMLVRPGTKWDADDDDSCSVVKLELEQDGKYVADEGFKVVGPLRLRMLLAVRPGTSKLAFKYYFEEFGEVTIPPGKVIPHKK